MKKITQTELKKYLSTFNEEQLINEILQIHKLYKNIQEYFQLKIKPDNENILMEKYKKVIENEFYPNTGDPKLRYSIMKKAISDFKKISKNPENIAELMISYVENGVYFTNDYGDIDGQFYNSIERMFNDALDYIFKNNLESHFHKRSSLIADDSRNIGWGFGDEMISLFYEFYDFEEEEEEEKSLV